jgi:hypothetical protein
MTTWPLLHPAPAWAAVCYIDGRPYQIVGAGWSKGFGFDRDRSSCTIELAVLVSVQGGEPAYVDVFCNGIPRRYFTGLVQRDVRRVDTGTGVAYRYQILDITGALDSSPSSAITWNNRAFDDAVTDLLTAAGLSSSQIGPIYDPGSTYTIGTFEAVTIETTENIAQVMRQLMEYGGTKLWVSPGGVVRVSDATGIPVASSEIAYVWLADSTQRGLQAAREQFGAISQIVTTWTAKGPTRSDNATPNYTFTASGISGRPDGNTYRFADNDSVCQAIAEREVARRARVEHRLSIDTMCDPDLMPGRTINVNMTGHPSINTVGLAFVESIAANGGDMTIACRLGASRVPGSGYADHPPPYADFAIVSVEAELVDVAGTLEKRLIVQVDASASYVSQGTIGYSWSVSGATPDPASIPAVVDPIFVLDTGSTTGVTITLSVSDGVSAGSSVTKALDTPEVQVVTRVLSIAKASNGWRILRDINTGYEDFTRAGQSCDATAKFSANGPLLSGWDDGALYAWEPEGGDATLLWTEPAGTGITSIYRNQDTPEDITVTAGTKLYRSQDDGATFALLYTAAATINDVETAPGGSYIRICTGNTVLNSYDSTTFPAAQTGEAGSTCQQQANAGFADGSNAACYTGTTTSAGLVVFDQGHTVDWSGVTAPSGITTISAALAEEAFICGDASGNLYKLAWDGSQYVASDIGQTDATGTVADLIRDDRLSELVFGSDSTWQTFKVLNFATILPIDLQPSVQIGIGPLANLSPRYRLLIPTVGLSGGGVYEYASGAWALRNAGLPATTTLYGQAVAANPANPDEWLALFTTNTSRTVQTDGSGNLVGSDGSTGVLWRWDGSTWTNIPVSLTVGSGSFIDPYLDWRTSGWAFVVGRTFGAWAVQGVGSTVGTIASNSAPSGRCVAIAADGAAVVGSDGNSSGGSNNDNVYYSSGSSLLLAGSAINQDRDFNYIAAYPTGTRIVLCSYDTAAGRNGYVYGAPDFRAAQPTALISSATAWSVQITTDERVYAGGGGGNTRTGIAEITDLFGTPSVNVIAASGVNVGRIGMDKQTRTLVAALNSSKTTVYLWDGSEEAVIDASSLTPADLADYVEVLT